MQKTPSIVVITDKNDAHLRYVQPHLAEPLYIIEPRSILDGSNFTYDLQGDRLVFTHGATRLNKVRSVWYRKPSDITKQNIQNMSVHADFTQYSLIALQMHIVMLLEAFQDAL